MSAFVHGCKIIYILHCSVKAGFASVIFVALLTQVTQMNFNRIIRISIDNPRKWYVNAIRVQAF